MSTVAFQGIEIVEVDVQVHIGGGLPALALVGLPDKAVAESRERVRAALAAIGLGLPPRRITINLSPADLHTVGRMFRFTRSCYGLAAVLLGLQSAWTGH